MYSWDKTEAMETVLNDISDVSERISKEAACNYINLSIFVKETREKLEELNNLIDELADMEEAV